MRAAKLAAAAAALKRQSGLTAPFSLAFLTDAERAPNPLLIARVLPAGAAIILRDYRLPNRAGLAAQLKSICDARDLKFLIGADLALAESIGAYGVHLPRWFEPDRICPDGMVVSAACHNAKELAQADAMGADIALLSPVFATDSHMRAAGLDAEKFLALAAGAPLPVLALGGVDETNALSLAGANVAGLAAIGAFLA
ncbi:MAG: thiamine phosphate synthase [Hyphococcus sp.]|nr:MAG: thiamine phosphate synthase [Marinicaulis sp.]